MPSHLERQLSDFAERAARDHAAANGYVWPNVDYKIREAILYEIRPVLAVHALELAQTALHKLCLARGSTDGYGHVFAAINEAL